MSGWIDIQETSEEQTAKLLIREAREKSQQANKEIASTPTLPGLMPVQVETVKVDLSKEIAKEKPDPTRSSDVSSKDVSSLSPQRSPTPTQVTTSAFSTRLSGASLDLSKVRSVSPEKSTVVVTVHKAETPPVRNDSEDDAVLGMVRRVRAGHWQVRTPDGTVLDQAFPSSESAHMALSALDEMRRKNRKLGTQKLKSPKPPERARRRRSRSRDRNRRLISRSPPSPLRKRKRSHSRSRSHSRRQRRRRLSRSRERRHGSRRTRHSRSRERDRERRDRDRRPPRKRRFRNDQDGDKKDNKRQMPLGYKNPYNFPAPKKDAVAKNDNSRKSETRADSAERDRKDRDMKETKQVEENQEKGEVVQKVAGPAPPPGTDVSKKWDKLRKRSPSVTDVREKEPEFVKQAPIVTRNFRTRKDRPKKDRPKLVVERRKAGPAPAKRVVYLPAPGEPELTNPAEKAKHKRRVEMNKKLITRTKKIQISKLKALLRKSLKQNEPEKKDPGVLKTDEEIDSLRKRALESMKARRVVEIATE